MQLTKSVSQRNGLAVLLVDTSVWVRIDQNQLRIRDYVSEEEDLATCPMVVHEVLRGTNIPRRFALMSSMLHSVTMLDDPMPLIRFEEAAQLYKDCRARGVTPSTPDCLITACAIAHKVPLFHLDADYSHIARAVPELQLFTRS